MRGIAIVIFFLACISTQAQQDIHTIRGQFHKASSERLLKDFIQQVSSQPGVLANAYHGIALAKSALYSNNPVDQYNLYKSGKERIDHSLQQNDCFDTRYARLLLELNVPSFLQNTDHITEDLAALNEYLYKPSITSEEYSHVLITLDSMRQNSHALDQWLTSHRQLSKL